MKFLVVFAAILAVSVAGKINIDKFLDQINNEIKRSEGSSEEDMESMIKDVQKQILDMSEEVGNKICENKGTEIKEALKTMFKCVESHPDDALLCDMYSKNFVTCMKPVEDMMTNCVAKNYHDLPKMFMESMSNTVEFVCNAQGKELVELFNPCARKNVEKLMKCKPEKMDFETAENAKTSICKTMMETKTCMFNEMKTTCKHELTMKAHNDLMEAMIIKPCKA